MRSIRFLLLTILLILLIVGFVPFLNGWFFKQKYFELIASLNADTDIKFVVREYHLGWRHSTALIDVTLPQDFAKSKHIYLEQHIEHGPLVFKEKGESFPANMHFQYAIIDGNLKLDNRILMNIQTNAYYSGLFNNQLMIPTVEVPIAMMGNIKWDGAKGVINLRAANNHIQNGAMDLDILPVVFQSPFGVFTISKINVHNEFNYHDQKNFDSAHQIIIPSVVLDIMEYDLRLSQLKLTHTFDVINNLYSSKTNLTMQQFAIPNLNLTPFNFSIGTSNLNFEALMQLMKMQKKDITPGLFLQSLTPQSEITSSIDFAIPEGKFHLDFKGTKSGKDFNAKDQISDRINFEMKITASKTFVAYMLELIAENHPTPSQIPAKPLSFDQQINVLVEQKLMSTYAASQLKALVQTPLTNDAFETALNQLAQTNEISPDAMMILKQSYSAMQNQMTPAVPQPTAKEKLNAEWDELVKAGYILEEKDNYVINFSNQNGVKLINGKPESAFPSNVDVKMLLPLNAIPPQAGIHL